VKLAGVSIVLALLVCCSSAEADSAARVTVTSDSAVATWVRAAASWAGTAGSAPARAFASPTPTASTSPSAAG
jgi:hypothetical protein